MDPEDVGGDGIIDATGLHFKQFLAPFALGIAAVVKLAHDRRPRLPVEPQTVAINGQQCAVRTTRFTENETPWAVGLVAAKP